MLPPTCFLQKFGMVGHMKATATVMISLEIRPGNVDQDLDL